MRRQGQATRRQTLAFRVVTLLTLAVVAIALLPHGVFADSPYSTLSPRSDDANDIQFLYKFIFWMALVVFVGVQVFIAYTALRFRRRSDDAERPEQIHGNKTLEIAWTIVPAIVLLVIFVPTVRTMYNFEARAQPEQGDYQIDVYAKQWWWEVHYAKPDAVAGVITANEIHVPVGKKVLFTLYSNNVIHSFWVPQLAGKMDVIPGHANKLGFTPSAPGYYYGQCAEFCGASHAWMQFKVIVEPQQQFDTWIAAWKAGPTQAVVQIAQTGDVAKAPPSMGLCISCHRINGTNLKVAPIGLNEAAETDKGAIGPAKYAGPNLTLFGCRTTIGAGVLKNTPENLKKWLYDPAAVKPGNYMATQIGPKVWGKTNIDQVVAYLESLKPDGGCAPLPGSPASQATPAGDPKS